MLTGGVVLMFLVSGMRLILPLVCLFIPFTSTMILVTSEARGHIEWRVKGLTTYLVHGSHEFFLFFFVRVFLSVS